MNEGIFMSGLMGISTAMSVFYIVLDIAGIMLCIAGYVAMAVFFMKAGKAPWKSLIPVYNWYILFDISCKRKLFIPYVIACVCTVVGSICMGTQVGSLAMYYGDPSGVFIAGLILAIAGVVGIIAFSIVLFINLSKVFGHGGGYAVGLFFLTNIFFMVIAFGKSEYMYKPAPIVEVGHLRCLSGDIAGTSIEMLDGESIIIGRSYDFASLIVDIDNPHSKISKKHCTVEFDGINHVYYVTDHSMNGTLLEDGSKLVKEVRTPIRMGTTIILPKDIKFILM